MENGIKEKLKQIVAQVDKAMIDPDIDIDYCIPEVEVTANNCNVNGDPYIIVKYAEDTYVERKIRLTPKYIEKTPEEIANLVTFSIEQFKEEIDSVKMGA